MRAGARGRNSGVRNPAVMDAVDCRNNECHPMHKTTGPTMYRNDLLQGQRILVTGGGTGLGAAMASRFASLGAALVLSGRRADVLDATAARLRAESGAAVTTLACDIRNPDAV